MDEETLVAGLNRERVTYGHINNIADVVNSEHFKARHLQAYVTYPDKDVRIPITAISIKMTGMEDQTEYEAYSLGYNTFEVLSKYAGEAELHAIYDTVMEESRKAAEDSQIKGGILKKH